MKRRHVAIFTNLGNGHVYPTLGLCTELINRGHRVTYVTNEHYSDRVRQTGAEPVLFTPAEFEVTEQIEQTRRMAINDLRRWAVGASCILPWFIKDATATLPQVEAFYTTDTPDVILYDRLAFAGRILAKRFDIPAVQLSCVVPPYRNYMARVNGVCMTAEPVVEFSRHLDGFLSTYGITGSDHLFHIEDLNICFIPKQFQHHADWFDDRFRFVGACLNRPLRQTWTRAELGKPLLLVSGLSDGDDVGYFKLVVAALDGLDYHTILSTGQHIDPDFLGSIPPNFEINRGADHLEMLPYVALTLCQGGVGTILESIYHGVPVICIPTNIEQEDNSYRVAELGLGRHLCRETLSADSIRNAITGALADRELLERVRQAQQEFKRSGGAREAADCIDELLSGRALP